MTSSRSSLCSPHPLRPRGESVQTEESHQEVAWAEGGWEGSVNNAVDLEWERERESERETVEEVEDLQDAEFLLQSSQGERE